MMYPMLDSTNRKRIFPFTFKGINRNDMIEDDNLVDCTNIDTYSIPFISPRKPMERVKRILNCNGFLYDLSKEVFVSGNNFHYDGNKFPLKNLNCERQLVEFNGHILIFPDNKAYDVEKNTIEDFKAPELDFVAVHDNRVFGVKGSDIRATSLGDYKSWETYKGVLTDSFATDTARTGNFTGMVSYRGHLTLFKDEVCYELFGNRPDQYTLKEAFKLGTISNKSIAEVGGTLIFLDKSGVIAYGGGLPKPIGYKLNEKYVKGVGFSDGRRYYLSLDNGKDKRTYIFDSNFDCWSVYSDQYFTHYASYFDGSKREIRAVNELGDVYIFNHGNEIVPWEVVTKEYDDNSFYKKSVSKFRLKGKSTVGTEFEVYVSYDGKPKELVKVFKHTDFSVTDWKEFRIQVPLRRCKRYQFTIVGKGHIVLYGAREITFRSER